MRKWLILLATIISEVSGSLALSAAQEHPAWYALTVIGYLGSFGLLGKVLQAGMPLGVAYGIWSACGVMLTALGGAVLLGDPLTRTMLGGMALIVVGVLLVQVGSERARAKAGPASTAPTSAAPTSAAPASAAPTRVEGTS